MQSATSHKIWRIFARLISRGRFAAMLVLIVLIGVRVVDPWWVEVPRLLLFDRLQAMHPRESTELRVMVVDID